MDLQNDLFKKESCFHEIKDLCYEQLPFLPTTQSQATFQRQVGRLFLIFTQYDCNGRSEELLFLRVNIYFNSYSLFLFFSKQRSLFPDAACKAGLLQGWQPPPIDLLRATPQMTLKVFETRVNRGRMPGHARATVTRTLSLGESATSQQRIAGWEGRVTAGKSGGRLVLAGWLAGEVARYRAAQPHRPLRRPRRSERVRSSVRPVRSYSANDIAM